MNMNDSTNKGDIIVKVCYGVVTFLLIKLKTMNS